ncbi:DUF4349 domain-containing protein [Kribbella sp. CA-293567]|uniref:DUF4349 domain-containing protein n=1 Tax=Kribbella sp. CA-293567 TaxID=3002436 RepID=UPI0022DD72DA|nr:DUF4349 domain-containing protein [Kribbella sp. CA-293567]WBQ07047.1 DUF4349 domain-containing protein [Kribbella sp. CA-293567]
MTRMRVSAAVTGVFLAVAVLLSGCSAGGGNDSAAGDSAAAPAKDSNNAGQESSTGAGGKAAPAAQPSITRAIIKTGALTVEVDGEDVSDQRQKAIGVVTGLRGQVASEDTSSNDDGRITQANLVLKVPTAAYETAIERLSGLGKRTSISQESSDVTEQVVDVGSRISSQRASLDRMRALLAKANSIGEIVSVESELTRREADLEALLAKQKNLSLQTELATLRLTLVEKGKTAEVAEAEDKGFLSGLRGGWNAFTATFSALATAVGALLPFLIALALIGYPLWRLRSRLRRNAQPAVATAGAPAGGPPLPKHPDQP